ncbi:hypothetical protein Tco_0568787 [Tanacetum coccineum]
MPVNAASHGLPEHRCSGLTVFPCPRRRVGQRGILIWSALGVGQLSVTNSLCIPKCEEQGNNHSSSSISVIIGGLIIPSPPSAWVNRACSALGVLLWILLRSVLGT